MIQKYTWDVPKRLKKKEGFFGTIGYKDVGYTAIFAGIGVLIAVITGGSIWGLLLLVMFGAGGYLLFIMKDAYGENARMKYERAMKAGRKQKLFYYYRGTGGVKK